MKSLVIVGLISGALAFLAWSFFKSVLRGVGRFGLSMSISAICGIAVGAAVANDADQVQVSIITAMALVVPTYLLLRKAPREASNVAPEKRVDPMPKPLAIETPKRHWFGILRRKPQNQSFEEAWVALSEETPWAANRVAIARRSCERFRERLQERKLDPLAHDLLVFMHKRIPEFIEAQLQQARLTSDSERHVILADLVDVLERYAADCERRSPEQLGSKELNGTALRSRIEEYLASGSALRL